MYIPENFAESDQNIISEHIHNNNFATVITERKGIPIASHLPLILEEEDNKPARLLGDMAVKNDHWRDFYDGNEALVIFLGPHTYISPSWYKNDNMVPTWNYSAVHVYGVPGIIEETWETIGILERATEIFEPQEKSKWSLKTLDQKLLDTMISNIVAFKISISRIEAKRKMGQNRRDEDVPGAIQKLEQLDDKNMQLVAKDIHRHLNKRVKVLD